MLPTTFRSIWPSCFRVEHFQKSTNQKQELAVAAMFVNGSGQNEQSLQRTFHRCFLPSFGSFGKAVSQDKIFRNRPIRNKNCLWQPYLLMDQDEMSNLYRGPFHRCFLPSFGSFGQTVSEEKNLNNQPIRNKNGLWWTCLLTDRDRMSIFLEDLPYMLPTKFRIIWTSGFRGEDFQKSTNQKQELPVAAMFVNGQGRNEHSLQRTAHRCFLPSFGSFRQADSEEKIFKNQQYLYRDNCILNTVIYI